MKEKIFGSSGIRGISGKEVTPSLAYEVGASIATSVAEGFIAVGHDSRLTAKMLEDSLVSGIISCGVDVKLLGLTPTPVIAFMTKSLGAKAGVSVTASHNPPEYNGIKVFGQDGVAYAKQKERMIEKSLLRRSFRFASWNQIGSTESIDVREAYIGGALGELRFRKRWHLALDLFNGAACGIIPQIVSRYHLKTAILNGQPDGRFPSGQPEPSPDTLSCLAEFVKEIGADIGFGYDGDGDRVLPVDEHGEIPHQDLVLAAYAAHVVRRNGGGVVVTHVEASRCVEDLVTKAGGRVLKTRVGDGSIAEHTQKYGAIFGGEPIGAWIHPQHHLCPDGILSSLLLLEALEYEGKNLSDFLGRPPSYVMLRNKISCPEEQKSRVMREVLKWLPEEFTGVKKMLRMDGLRLELDRSWILVRLSGTEPFIRLTVEAEDPSQASKLMRKGEQCVRGFLEAS